MLLLGKRGGNFPQQPLGCLQSATVHGVTDAGHILANAGFGVVIVVTDAADAIADDGSRYFSVSLITTVGNRSRSRVTVSHADRCRTVAIPFGYFQLGKYLRDFSLDLFQISFEFGVRVIAIDHIELAGVVVIYAATAAATAEAIRQIGTARRSHHGRGRWRSRQAALRRSDQRWNFAHYRSRRSMIAATDRVGVAGTTIGSSRDTSAAAGGGSGNGGAGDGGGGGRNDFSISNIRIDHIAVVFISGGITLR